MPSDSNGNYSLPPGYLATTGEPILASQHNPPLEDVAAALTARMLKNGATPMTGQLQLADGTVTAPGLTFASATGTGLFKTANGFAVAINGVQVFEFTAAPSALPIGLIGDWPGVNIPSGWSVCFGQSLLRATYPALFLAIGTTYGAADGAHFSLPDLRGVVTAGMGNMGGVDRGILTGSTAYNALLGAQTVTFAQAYLPALTWPTTLSINDTQNFSVSGQGAGTVIDGAGSKFGGGGSGSGATLGVSRTGSVALTGGTTSGGSGTPLPNVQPTTAMNKIICTGVA